MLGELLKLQKIDSNIDNLKSSEANMPEKREKADLLVGLNRFKDKVKEVEIKLKQANLEQDKTEGELKLLEEKIKRESEKLYSGKVTNPKELSGIQIELSHLNEKKESIEEDLIMKLDETSEINNLKVSYDGKIGEIESKVNKLKDIIEQKSFEINIKVEALKSERQKQVQTIDSELLEEYEDLRSKNQGIAIAEMTNGVCQACYVELPGAEVDKMKPGEKNYCSFCGRMIKY